MIIPLKVKQQVAHDNKGTVRSRILHIASDYRIEYGQHEITISDSEGNEVVHWIQDEWEEDPQVVFSIANAIQMTCENGIGYTKAILAKKQKIQD